MSGAHGTGRTRARNDSSFPHRRPRVSRRSLGRGLIRTQPDSNNSDFDRGEVSGGELLVTGCDAPKLFEFVEETFDPVARAVEVS